MMNNLMEKYRNKEISFKKDREEIIELINGFNKQVKQEGLTNLLINISDGSSEKKELPSEKIFSSRYDAIKYLEGIDYKGLCYDTFYKDGITAKLVEGESFYADIKVVFTY